MTAPQRIVIIGAGPTGLTLGAALARRGHSVLAVDRDPGPAADGSWHRIGVGQFEHAHGFRAQVPDLLESEFPEALRAWRRLGAELTDVDLPGGGRTRIVRSRRITYERALRRAAADTAGLDIAVGRVTAIVEERGAATGVMVDGRHVAADVVIDASGRGLGPGADRPVLNSECGITYVGRQYRLHPGVPLGPLTTPVAWGATFDGYQVIVFPHEDRHVSAVIVRHAAETRLHGLREVCGFESAVAAIPGMADWIDPSRAAAVSGIVLGGRPRNVYRHQRRLTGSVMIGDAVATTTPTAGRGVAMASMQIRALLDLLDDGHDPRTVSSPFQDWCAAAIRPWVEEHIARDDEAVRRLGGADIDLSLPLTTSAIVDAAQVEPGIVRYLADYLSMNALPTSLAEAEPMARAVYERGWRPAVAEGPTVAELSSLIDAAEFVPPACSHATPIALARLF